MAKRRGPSKATQRKGGRAAARSRKSPIGRRKRGSGRSRSRGTSFAQMTKRLSGRKGVRNPKALAATIGRRSLGKAAFQKRAAAGRKKAASRRRR